MNSTVALMYCVLIVLLILKRILSERCEDRLVGGNTWSKVVINNTTIYINYGVLFID